MRQTSWLRLAAIGTWAVCGVPSIAAFAGGGLGWTTPWWIAAFGLYGLALVAGLWTRASSRTLTIVFVACQSVAAVVLTYLVGAVHDPTPVGLIVGIGLMVIVAAQLPHILNAVVTVAWIGGQTLASMLVVWATRRVGMADTITFGLGAAGFQAFAGMTTGLMLRESAARAELARTNADLHATRALLAEHSRAGERLRIARDLHDTIGHHLTALSLQLDIGSRLADGRTAEHVRRAHAITRLLLAEVRSVVGAMRDCRPPDLTQAIRELVASTSDTVAIHLDMPDRIAVDDTAQADSLLRCVQEIITNTARHADARNLWIRIEAGADGIELDARDDGRGTHPFVRGNGLNGMRERFAEYGGRVEFGRPTSGGFEVQGFMPTPQAACSAEATSDAAVRRRRVS